MIDPDELVRVRSTYLGILRSCHGRVIHPGDLLRWTGLLGDIPDGSHNVIDSFLEGVHDLTARGQGYLEEEETEIILNVEA